MPSECSGAMNRTPHHRHARHAMADALATTEDRAELAKLVQHTREMIEILDDYLLARPAEVSPQMRDYRMRNRPLLAGSGQYWLSSISLFAARSPLTCRL